MLYVCLHYNKIWNIPIGSPRACLQANDNRRSDALRKRRVPTASSFTTSAWGLLISFSSLANLKFLLIRRVGVTRLMNDEAFGAARDSLDDFPVPASYTWRQVKPQFRCIREDETPARAMSCSSYFSSKLLNARIRLLFARLFTSSLYTSTPRHRSISSLEIAFLTMPRFLPLTGSI